MCVIYILSSVDKTSQSVCFFCVYSNENRRKCHFYAIICNTRIRTFLCPENRTYFLTNFLVASKNGHKKRHQQMCWCLFNNFVLNQNQLILTFIVSIFLIVLIFVSFNICINWSNLFSNFRSFSCKLIFRLSINR